MALTVKYFDTSAANTAQTVSTITGAKLRIRYVTVAYSAAPTQTGVIIALNSGSGADYDTTLFTGAANVQDTFWQPDHDLPIEFDDQLDVTAPAAGGAITSSVVIYCEVA